MKGRITFCPSSGCYTIYSDELGVVYHGRTKKLGIRARLRRHWSDGSSQDCSVLNRWLRTAIGSTGWEVELRQRDEIAMQYGGGPLSLDAAERTLFREEPALVNRDAKRGKRESPKPLYRDSVLLEVPKPEPAARDPLGPPANIGPDGKKVRR